MSTNPEYAVLEAQILAWYRDEPMTYADYAHDVEYEPAEWEFEGELEF